MVRNILNEFGEPVTLRISRLILHADRTIEVLAEGWGDVVLEYDRRAYAWRIRPVVTDTTLAPNGEPWGDE